MRRFIGLVAITSALLFACADEVSAGKCGRGCGGGGRHGGGRHHGCNSCCYSGCYSCAPCAGGVCGPMAGCPGGVCAMPGGGHHHASLAAPATLVVQLPADAVLTVDGQTTRSTSGVRTFQTPNLERGYDYSYTLQVRVGDDLVTQEVTVRAGEQTSVNFDATGVTVTQR